LESIGYFLSSLECFPPFWRTPEHPLWEYPSGCQNPGEKDKGLMIYINLDTRWSAMLNLDIIPAKPSNPPGGDLLRK
jgi:hypothetical protein